jgi:hypothetical protein
MKRDSKNFRKSKTCRGVTLVELMLSLSILSLVGICIAMMIKGTADGTAGATDGRRHLVRMQSLEAQIANTVRPCMCILAAGNGYIVLWTGDGQNPNIATNQAVNLSELVMIEHDSTNRKLKIFRTSWPAGTSVATMIANDTLYAGNASWYSSATAAKGTYFTGTTIANNVTSCNVTLDSANATSAMMATLWITLDDGVVSRTVVIPASLRQRLVPQ